uniref:uncharacterized protein LOC117258737 isoform X2 n=1 Tax=Epinephelus lanceolatus TaxID=310571 RepID=UPI001444C125|nr:uncharacterized protein LOC117258737 isoform X2 [Epinephelus lanceolatus]
MDPIILAKLHFMSVKKFSTFSHQVPDRCPMIPLPSRDLEDLIRSLLRRFIKQDVQVDVSPVKLVMLDVTDQRLWVSPMQVDIGMGATAALKCPLKYPTGRNTMCLDPQKMLPEPDTCLQKNEGPHHEICAGQEVVRRSHSDEIAQQFQQFLFSEARGEEFMAFSVLDGKSRVDSFLHEAMNGYAELWSFVEKLLLLSHGQATVERGFFINKEVEMCNMNKDTVVSQRLICDYVSMCGGVLKVPLTKELLNECTTARNRYRIDLEDERKKKEKTKQMDKRKRAEDELEELCKKRRTISSVCETLEKDADSLGREG